MDFGCKEFSNFVEKLYDFLTEINLCFLSGTLVFDNKKQQLYNSLMKGHRLFKRCDNVKQRTKAGSHRSFITQKDFSKARLKAGARSDEYKIRDPVSAKQYDKTINPPLTYLCDKRCRSDETDCIPGNKEPKGIALFYPFTVVNQAESIDYLFMKLEQYATSLAHPIDATKHLGHYFARKVGHKKKMTHPERREDDPIDLENAHNDKEALLAYYIRNGATGEQAGSLFQKIDFFNRNVRVGNEVYIPSEILEIVFRVEIKPKTRVQKAIKKVIAMSRVFPISDGIGSDKWLRKHAALMKRAQKLKRHPFSDVPCMEATYPDSKNRPTPFTREQLLSLARYMGLPVTDDMTKQQLCDLISP